MVQDGQIRFTIDGQEPILASKGFIVQVPYRTMYTLETIGDRPSLRLEVNIARARKMYPLDVTPAPVAGVEFVKSRVAGRGTYDGTNKPFVDFNAVVAGTDKTRGFVVDDRGFANIILGRGIPPPPASDKGHFHTESSEFWFILLGQIRYNIEGLPVFVADQGDIVYVPSTGIWPACRRGPSERCERGYPDWRTRSSREGSVNRGFRLQRKLSRGFVATAAVPNSSRRADPTPRLSSWSPPAGAQRQLAPR